MSPKVSVIIPVYNAAKFLPETLQSVTSQTLTDWETILVIDQKSDAVSEEICQSWADKDKRFKIISRQSAGTANNRNCGLDTAQGKFIAFLDADDLWKKEKLHEQVTFMENGNFQFSFHAFQRFSESGDKLGRVLHVPAQVSYRDLLSDNTIGCLTVMLSRELVKNIRFEDKGWEDFGYWLKCLKKVPAAHGLDKILAMYRVVESSRSNNKIFAAKMRWMALRQQENFGFITAVIWMIPYAWTGLVKHRLSLRFRSKV